MQTGTNACPICSYFIWLLFCTACRAYMMWTFLFATCFANTAWHYRQCIMAATLCTACFTCFTSWRCHFLSFYSTVVNFIQLFPICKQKIVNLFYHLIIKLFYKVCDFWRDTNATVPHRFIKHFCFFTH